MKPFQQFVTFFAAALLLPVSFAVAQIPKPSDLLPLYADVKIGKLPNGLTFYIRKDQRLAHYVDLRLVVHAGSLQEDDSQHGLAHVVAHMAFNSTTHFSKDELSAVLKSIGQENVPLGADNSARVGFEETVYTFQIRADENGTLDKGLTVLEDWASGIAFKDDEINAERTVILNEINSEKAFFNRKEKMISARLYGNPKYVASLPLTDEASINAFKQADLKRYYTEWYRPDLMAVVVFGDVDPAEAERLINLHFSKLKSPPSNKARISYPVVPLAKSAAIKFPGVIKDASDLQIYHQPKKSPTLITVSDLRNALLQKITGSMMATRLNVPAAPYLLASVKTVDVGSGYDALYAHAYVKGDVPTVVVALVKEIEKVRSSGFTAAELEAARTSLLQFADSEFLHENRLERLGDDLTQAFLLGKPILDLRKKIDLGKSILTDLTLNEINQYSTKTLSTDGSKLVILSGDTPLPTTDELVAIVDNPSSVAIKKPTEKVLMSTLPAPGKILSTRSVKEGNYTELRLSNGITVLLKPVTTKKNNLFLSGFRSGGFSLYSQRDRAIVEFTAQTIPQMGVGSLSLADLQTIIGPKKTFAFPRIDETSEGMMGLSQTGDMETMLQMVHLLFTQPRRDESSFQTLLAAKLAEFERQDASAERLFYDSISSILYINNPVASRKRTAAFLQKIELNRVFSIYKERFSDITGYTFVISGPFDLTTTIPLVATYLGSLPVNGTAVVAKDNGFRFAKGVIHKTIKVGHEEKSIISMHFTGESAYSPLEKLRLRALQDLINTRLREKLPEQFENFSGGLPKSSFENFHLTASMRCAPTEVDNVIKTTLAEFVSMKSVGPTKDELDRAKTEWKETSARSLQNPEHWVRELQTSIETKTSIDTWLNSAKYIDALTADDLKATANKYLSMKNYVEVVMKSE